MAGITAADTTGEPPAALLDLVLNSAEVGTFLRALMDEMVAVLGGAGRGIGWAVTLVRTGITGTWAADSARTGEIDRLQHSFDDGPALAALRSGFVHVGETGLERRWPGYGNAAASFGVQSLLSVPLISNDVFAATVSLYAPLPHAFSSADIMTARSYARQGMRGLRLALELFGKKEDTAARVPAPGSQDLVSTALKILMEEYRLSYEAALHYLHTAARSRSVGLEQAALEIIAAGPQSRSYPDTAGGAGNPGDPSPGATSARAKHSGTGASA